MEPSQSHSDSTWATYQDSTKARTYRKQPYWALRTYCGKYWCKGTEHFNVGNNITCIIYCNYRTAATLCTLETWFVSGILLPIPCINVITNMIIVIILNICIARNVCSREAGMRLRPWSPPRSVPFTLPGRDSIVGIATRYGLEVRGSNLGGARFSASVQTGRPLVQSVPDLSRGWSGWGVALTTHLLLAPRLKKE
jgi:hypothetical protein